MSLRTKLLLLSLLTLILPWAGWKYAQQMENTLRSGQEAALLTTAEVLGRVVASEPELLYRVGEARDKFDPAAGDLFAPLFPTQPLVDGFADEWPEPSRPVPGFEAARPGEPLLHLGVYGRSLHLFAEIETPRRDYESPPANEGSAAPGSSSDRLIILTRDEFGRERAWSVSALAPGPIIVRPCDIGSPWRPHGEVMPPYVNGVWRETTTGYAVELRGPMNLFGTQIAVFALNKDNTRISGTQGLARLHTGSEALKQRLEQYAPEGVRVSVVDVHGWLLARAGAVTANASSTYPGLQRNEYGFMRSIYRGLFPSSSMTPQPYGLPYGMWGAPVDEARAGKNAAIWFDQLGGEPSLVRAAVPVRYGEELLGALVVEQPGEQLVLVRELALTRLLNLTLVATLFAIVVTLVFAARLSHRIRRLSRAASTALTAEGRIEHSIPGTEAKDELGALARSYDTLLGRVKEYTIYLQTLGTKLSHELRTPLTIVSSSLDNLVSEEALQPNAQSYVDRARSGTNRMHAILTALSEATRVEQSIEHTDRVRFDLSELVRNMGQAYQHTFARHRIETSVPNEACTIDGSPDLIAQLLDKLMDNAADFTPPGGRIGLALEAGPRACRLSVSNEGPPLPAQLNGRLFESLVSSRGSSDGKPHLGLGLYIVRLIADFHASRVTATNLNEDAGVAITLEIPRT
ncbi:HAMP domain-containing protein [Steroidobacter sp. S1-65]|uniref:histidine kinase n=1 Tax=Steroidobacter gossypii TaxID=2805490 RepID=A0ABS1WS90_9GAMM|nr:ATP-binding protein [Steroidobacter gossypii]MBM0103817.1 HAMP domain-containing protein [Steroidobacter gossypii]